MKKGLLEFMESGLLSGHKIFGIGMRLFDGSDHEVDSSELAFKIATKMALREAYLQANPAILEPIMKASITIPKQYFWKNYWRS